MTVTTLARLVGVLTEVSCIMLGEKTQFTKFLGQITKQWWLHESMHECVYVFV